MSTPERTKEDLLKRDFGEIEFRIKCMFCNAEDQNQKEFMGHTWRREWTCPNCGIRYHAGKGMWGGARCLFLEIGQGEEIMFQKTAEWEKAGHEYKEEPKNFCAFCPKALKFEEVHRIEIMMNLRGNFAKMTVPICQGCKDKKAWIQSIPTIPSRLDSNSSQNLPKPTKKNLTKAESRQLRKSNNQGKNNE